MIRLTGVHKSYRPYMAPKSWFHVSPVAAEHAVLGGVDLHVQAGEIVGVEGVNGAGKSTLLRIVAGLIEADAGSVSTSGGVSLLDTAHFHFSERLTAMQNLKFFAALHGISSDEAVARIRVGAEVIGADFLDRRVNGLSAGMRQMLHWLLALLPRAGCLLLDEPFALLDEKRAEAVCALLQSYVEQESTCCLVASHESACLQACCSRRLALSRGVLR